MGMGQFPGLGEGTGKVVSRKLTGSEVTETWVLVLVLSPKVALVSLLSLSEPECVSIKWQLSV